MAEKKAPAIQWLTVREIIARTKLDRKVVYRLIAKGDIPSSRVGEKIIRVEESDLTAWQQSRRNNPRF